MFGLGLNFKQLGRDLNCIISQSARPVIKGGAMGGESRLGRIFNPPLEKCVSAIDEKLGPPQKTFRLP